MAPLARLPRNFFENECNHTAITTKRPTQFMGRPLLPSRLLGCLPSRTSETR
jgi:hypothetical protein